MPTSPPARDLLTGRPALLAVTGVLAAGLLLVGWLDQRATRRELIGTVRAHAEGLRETIGAAARANDAASRLAEAQMVDRLRDNARMLATLETTRPLDAGTLEAIVRDNALFRVSLFDSSGARELSVGTGGYGFGGGERQGRGQGGPGAGLGLGPGAGAGPGTQQLVRRVLDGEAEALGEVHAARRAGAGRLAVAVKRPRGGAILVNADASAVLQLQQQTSLDVLLADIVEHATDVAYVVVQAGEVTKWAGALPDDLRAMVQGPAPSVLEDTHASRDVLVDGRPVLEFSGPMTAGDGGTVRLGMRLDEIRATERRFRLRQAASLVMALIVGALALAYAWVRQRYGTLSVAHARAQDALKRRDRLAAMGELASTVAHEIRNPLNAIAMSAQRLRVEAFTDANDEEARSLVNVIHKESERIDNRIQQFLAFARPPALVLADVPLGALVGEIGRSLRPSAELRGLDLRVDTASAAVARIDGDQMRQVIDNLVRNAIDATPSGGHIELRAMSGADGHQIVVSDSGVGIAPEDLPKIFDLYFTTKSEGTGVGLAIAQQIVGAHGGRIDVDSTASAGTTFTVLLPAHTP